MMIDRARNLLYLAWKNKRTPIRSPGFTIIELLTVIVILGILSAIAIPSFLNQAKRARETEAKSYVSAINQAQQMYFVENSKFGLLSNLELEIFEISDSSYYAYASTPSQGNGYEALTTATPIAEGRGFAGKVWLKYTAQGLLDSSSIICNGNEGQVPAISGTRCP
ncbi:MAG: prepilin-type N-terminal cleavage/methylation domain-containing protein [Cyanobacteria bacterium CRU_2_1]|nr:prepilin-type N-terminal cleavage/methylation domain-containing protein [Cyanobacteria bacterium CRU_2_1]